MNRLLPIVILVPLLFGCKVTKKSSESSFDASVLSESDPPKKDPEKIEKPGKPEEVESVEKRDPIKTLRSLVGLPDSKFVRLADFDEGFAYDLRYATKNNFLKEKVYKCAECYVRSKTARALIEANRDFKNAGLRIRFFDCYRPNSVQHKMWKLVPDPRYVANPEKGSIHNKGGAVDITLETLEGVQLNMGTDFDFFGKRSHHSNTDLSKEVLANRKQLKKIMEKHGFKSMRSEWWHYHLEGARKDPIANFEWACE